MYPILFEIGPFIISSFGVMLVTAFLVCNYLLKKDIEVSAILQALNVSIENSDSNDSKYASA